MQEQPISIDYSDLTEAEARELLPIEGQLTQALVSRDQAHSALQQARAVLEGSIEPIQRLQQAKIDLLKRAKARIDGSVSEAVTDVS